MIEANLWAILTLANKWLGYLGTSAAIGGPFALLVFFRRSGFARPITNYVLLGCGLGILAAVSGFLIQVGSFADQGIQGVLNPTYFTILWQSNLQSSALAKVCGFVLIAIGSTLSIGSSRPNSFAYALVSSLIVALGIAVLALSFQYVGHTAEAGVFARLAIFFHVIAMGLWIGSLYPLWLACRAEPLAELQESMARFGRWAAYFVFVLLVSGGFLITVLIEDISTLLSTAYGWGLLVKLLLVATLLLLAAGNKWFFVPDLTRTGASWRLSRSVSFEMALAILIFLVTGYITTFVGPA